MKKIKYKQILKGKFGIEKIESIEQLFNQVELLGGTINVSIDEKKFYKIERL